QKVRQGESGTGEGLSESEQAWAERRKRQRERRRRTAQRPARKPPPESKQRIISHGLQVNRCTIGAPASSRAGLGGEPFPENASSQACPRGRFCWRTPIIELPVPAKRVAGQRCA